MENIKESETNSENQLEYIGFMNSVKQVKRNIDKLSYLILLGGMILGMEISSLTLFLNESYFVEYFGSLTSFRQGLLTAASPLGGIFGCMMYGIIMKSKGRIWSFRFGTTLWIIGSIIAASVWNIWIIVIARFLKGITVGMFSILLTAYINEIFPMERKGKSIAILHFGTTVSIFLTYLLCSVFNFLKNHYSFRIVWMIESIPAIFLLIGTLWMPESPRWLTLHGEYEKAIMVQNRLIKEYNWKKIRNFFELTDKLDIITLYGKESESYGYNELFKQGCWKQMLLCILLQILLNFSGMSILLYYIPYVCEMIGLENDFKILAGLAPYFVNMLLGLLPLTYIENIGRKDLILVGSIPCSIFMILIGTIMGVCGYSIDTLEGSTGVNNNNNSINWKVDFQTGSIIFALCLIFISFFTLTLANGPNIYIGEILPLNARPKGFILNIFIGWVLNFSITLLCPLLFCKLKWGVFLLFGIISLMISIILFKCLIETKGLEIGEINKLFEPRTGRIEKDVQDSSETKEFNFISSLKSNSGQDGTGKLDEEKSNFKFLDDEKEIELITPITFSIADDEIDLGQVEQGI
ncbi:hypothetical protein TBLA_0C00430 [Henningerozyma blattae CBS 6284]|uniref:Major facilitator superfamily (MFS) profile domain-containing protein n=1 Tax=Henningerozyma blattae (strain ATCC 34711 / CBS 6284 / DSM 70876 / NBRC 10599 / NRRL Y-10934 / UCD 77-7) TaxID=1071380 RepID=I2H0F7_HENB6|nr:hypothetical protein TBLA_0C00430 [Tetrapisispora blattae CBS 6284]CCH59859.1 hypothetical protein TBLA_0C00430 [Tetrapisispora blattae CBS 6284]